MAELSIRLGTILPGLAMMWERRRGEHRGLAAGLLLLGASGTSLLPLRELGSLWGQGPPWEVPSL